MNQALTAALPNVREEALQLTQGGFMKFISKGLIIGVSIGIHGQPRFTFKSLKY